MASRKLDPALRVDDLTRLEQMPNIGPRLARDLRMLGILKPSDLGGKDPHKLYLKLCKLTSEHHDPCVLDTFMAAVDFAGGSPPKPWWAFTAERKKRFPECSVVFARRAEKSAKKG